MQAKSEARPGNSSRPSRQEWPSRSPRVISRAMKSKARARHVDPVGLAEQRAGVGERGDHQPVPVGQHLVVEAGPHALLARARAAWRAAWRAAPRRPSLRGRRCEPVEDVVAFEIALRRSRRSAARRTRRRPCRAPLRSRRATRRRTCPPRLRSRRRARRENAPSPVVISRASQPTVSRARAR